MIRVGTPVVCPCLSHAAPARILLRRRQGGEGRGDLPTPGWYVCGLCVVVCLVNQSDKEEKEKENKTTESTSSQATMTASAWKEGQARHLQARQRQHTLPACMHIMPVWLHPSFDQQQQHSVLQTRSQALTPLPPLPPLSHQHRQGLGCLLSTQSWTLRPRWTRSRPTLAWGSMGCGLA